MTQMRKEYYSFNQFAKDIPRITQAIRAVERSRGKRFTKIYGPPRGGLPLAVCLSHQLNIPILLCSPFEIIPPGRYASTPELDLSDLHAKEFKILTETILIVDDIADSGKTLEPFHSAEFFIATLYKHPHSCFEPQLWLHSKNDAWIEFWWEAPDLLAEHERI